MIVLDTHAWLWWVSNPELLSRPASLALETVVEEKAVFIATISAWEVAMLVQKGRLQLTMDDWPFRGASFSLLRPAGQRHCCSIHPFVGRPA